MLLPFIVVSVYFVLAPFTQLEVIPIALALPVRRTRINLPPRILLALLLVLTVQRTPTLPRELEHATPLLRHFYQPCPSLPPSHHRPRPVDSLPLVQAVSQADSLLALRQVNQLVHPLFNQQPRPPLNHPNSLIHIQLPFPPITQQARQLHSPQEDLPIYLQHNLQPLLLASPPLNQ